MRYKITRYIILDFIKLPNLPNLPNLSNLSNLIITEFLLYREYYSYDWLNYTLSVSVYDAHAAQTNVRDMVTGFAKKQLNINTFSSVKPWRWSAVEYFTSILIWLSSHLGCLIHKIKNKQPYRHLCHGQRCTRLRVGDMHNRWQPVNCQAKLWNWRNYLL